MQQNLDAAGTGKRGYKGVHRNKDPIIVGSSHHTDRFAFTEHAPFEGFSVGIMAGRLIVASLDLSQPVLVTSGFRDFDDFVDQQLPNLTRITA